ncbi:MAG: PEP-CTERM sorting domain-containing protein [Chlorobaculum sp.]|nr:PEP-CTERM sorting domain-containing protein [Chlorobaculum sp.]
MKKQSLAILMLLGSAGISSQVHAAENILSLSDIIPTAGSSASIVSGGILQLTNNVLSKPTYQIGSAYSAKDANYANFNASFSFRFSGTGSIGSADGLVFVIKNAGSKTTGGDGGGLGYGTITTGSGSYTGIPNSIGIEFDNWVNPEVSDPKINHIGINTNGKVTSLATANVSPSFNGNGPWYAWVDYDGSNLSVSVSTSNAKPETAMLTYEIGDLESIIGSPTALIGFTGSTGGATQTEQVLSLNYTNNEIGAVPEPGMLALFGTGGLMAFGRKHLTRRRTIA